MESQFGMSEAIGGCNCNNGGAVMRMPKKNNTKVPKKPVSKKPAPKKPVSKKPAPKKSKK